MEIEIRSELTNIRDSLITRRIIQMKKKSILIVNYGMGNIGSVSNALDYLGGKYVISNHKRDLGLADAIILPGVGAFGAAMENLRQLDLVDELTEQVTIKKKPFLGICLGMQLLAKDSVEMGHFAGLGWIDGNVVEIDPSAGLRVPHVGWNEVTPTQPDPLFRRIEEGAHFYFDHSFHLQCSEPAVSAVCEYGGRYVAAIQKENILAVQFHPEKSQRSGLKLLRNFLNFVNTY